MKKLYKKKILITGGCGAIGQNLVKLLVAKKYDVSVVDNLSSSKIDDLPKNIKFYNVDITNYKNLKKIFKTNITAVIHLAAFFANQNSVENPISDLNTNGKGTLNIIKLCEEFKVKKLIYASSSCVYGNQKTMLENNNNFKPETPYAITKLLGEYYCNFFSENIRTNISIVRIFNSYGPGERPGKYRNVIPNFIYKAINNQNIIITGSGKETRDFTYVDDIIEGLYKILINNKIKSGEIFNLGSGKTTTILNLVKKIIKITNSKSKIIFAKKRSWDNIKTRKANISKCKRMLNYDPQWNLDEGLIKTLKWIKKIKM